MYGDAEEDEGEKGETKIRREKKIKNAEEGGCRVGPLSNPVIK